MIMGASAAAIPPTEAVTGVLTSAGELPISPELFKQLCC